MATINARPAHKRMRKGTRSCLSCRQRKARCVFPTDDGAPCIECASRGLPCQPQGIVEDGRAWRTNRQLMQRITSLEAELARVVGREGGDASASMSSDDTRFHDAISALQQLRSVSEHASRASTAAVTGEEVAYGYSDDEGSQESVEAEEQVRTTAAPLMTALDGSHEDPATVTSIHQSPGTTSIVETKTALRKPSSHAAKLSVAIRDLSDALPDEAGMLHIFEHHSSWWPLYRETLGLDWGDDSGSSNGSEQFSFPSFAARALADGQPTSLGLLLTCCAIATGERQRFLPPVEQHIVHNDTHASTEDGLACLMALGLCYLSALQPRRAWVVYRRANTLLQLGGIHLTHARSAKHSSLFWQLLHADRWCSLMIGLPYMVLDHFCDVRIETMQSLGPGIWLYRQFALITGRIIDFLQSTPEAGDGGGLRLSKALELEERLDMLRSRLPPDYLDLQRIQASADSAGERLTRLYRLVHFHQLRAYVHLPCLLRASNPTRQQNAREAFSRATCLADCRALLDAYLALHAADPRATSDGTIINFTAFTAAVVLLLCIIRRPVSASPRDDGDAHDWSLVDRVQEAIGFGARQKISAALCRRCHSALAALVAIARGNHGDGNEVGRGGPVRQIVIPYFGTVAIHTGPRDGGSDPPLAQAAREYSTTFESYATMAPATAAQEDGVNQAPFPSVAALGYDTMMDFAYQGPWLPETIDQHHAWDTSSIAFPSLAEETDLSAFRHVGGEAGSAADSDWVYADLPQMML